MSAGVRETMARESLRVRALRAQFFPGDIFAEYGWVVLLHAYLRHIGAPIADDGETIPPLDGQVMGHWRRYLDQQALTVPGGVPSEPPVLTAEGLSRMESYLDRLVEVADTLP